MVAGYLDLLTTTARVTIADDAGFDLTNDAEWRYHIAADDYTPAATVYIADRWLTTGNFRAWRIQHSTTGDVLVGLEDGAGAFRITVQLDWVPPADGEDIQVRITLDADDGANRFDISLYTRTGAFIQDLESDSDWTLQEANVDNAPAQTWKASTSGIALHSQSEGAAANGFLGKFYRIIQWADLTKTTKCFDVNFGDDSNMVGGDPSIWNDAARTGDWTVAGVEDTDWAWVATPVADFRILENGTDSRVLENTTDVRITEGSEPVGDATATPATVNAIAAILAATKSASVEKTATTVNAIAAVPLATAIGGTTTLPASVNAIAAVPAVTKTASVEKAATTVNAIAAIPAATKTASVEKAVATVNAVTAIPTPVTIGGTTALPATVNAIAAIPAVTKTASVEKTATTVNLITAIPQATRVASVEKNVSTVNLVAAIPATTRTASVEKAITTVNAVAAVPAATVTGGTTTLPATVNVVAAVPASTRTASVEKSQLTVNAVAFIPQAAASGTGSATVVPATVNAPAAIPLVVVSSSTTKIVTTVNLIAAIPAVTKTASVELFAVTINIIVGIPLVTVTGPPVIFYDLAPGGGALIGAEAGVYSVGVETGGRPLVGVEGG